MVKEKKRDHETYRFPLWKNNKVDQEYYLTISDFKKSFFTWMLKKEKAWLEYYGSRQSIFAFVGEDLQSFIEHDMYDILAEELQDEFWDKVEKATK